MVMRVPGLATGMDTEAMVNKLMEAERMPLMRMKQDQTRLEWKRDAFRDVNRVLLQLEELIFDMKLSRTYQSKNVTSTRESAVTATANSGSVAGSYSIEVNQLARAAMNVGTGEVDLDKVYEGEGPIVFSTFDEAGQEVLHEIQVEEGDTIGNIVSKINNSDSPVRVFYEANSQQVVLEATRTGVYNENGNEIVFDENSFFARELNLDPAEEKGAQNAEFIYNHGLAISSKSNSYTINGINLQFHDVTEGTATLTVANDTDHAFDSIMKFVDQYNEVVEALNAPQQERVYRDYSPLTEEQMEEMSDKQIELWEEKAKSGILRGESVLSNGLFSMRQSWYANVETGAAFTSLTSIGISTSPDYMDGGKLVVDEDKLRKALEEDAASVQKLFSNSSKDESRGLINRLEDTVKNTMSGIERQAGKDFHSLDNYALGRRMKDLNDRISTFEAKLLQVENRYWNQFTQMEKAIQRMNEQSSHLFSQFYGG